MLHLGSVQQQEVAANKQARHPKMLLAFLTRIAVIKWLSLYSLLVRASESNATGWKRKTRGKQMTELKTVRNLIPPLLFFPNASAFCSFLLYMNCLSLKQCDLLLWKGKNSPLPCVSAWVTALALPGASNPVAGLQLEGTPDAQAAEWQSPIEYGVQAFTRLVVLMAM